MGRGRCVTPAPRFLPVADSRLEELRRRVAQDPGSRLFAALAEQHRRAGDLAEAVRVARAGLARYPTYPAARLTLGRALLEAGDVRGALAELREALRQAPDSSLASRLLAEALEAGGDLDGACRQLAATLQLVRGDEDLEARLRRLTARLAAEQAKRGSAGSGAERPRADASPSPERAGGEGSGGGANPAGGVDHAEAVPFSSPTLAELYLRQGFAARAIEVYRRVIAENPENEKARARLSELQALAGRQEAEQADGRRRKLQRTIDGLEALLGATRRR